jgi:hypothetical protein
MISTIGRALRLVLHRPAPGTTVVEQADDARASLDVEFSAYAEECRLFGRIGLDAERLSDMLNAHDELVLVDVLATSLADGLTYEVDEISLSRDELMVVEALGPRGNPNRRTRARPHPLAVKLGPYEVRGYVHVTPGADILNAVRRRRPMVPLTEASISYASGGVLQRHRAGTLIFNRECADWLTLADDESIEFPELPLPVSMGPMVKDFTGQLLTFQDY